MKSDKNNPKEIFAWKMYDWANSAFYTTVVGALFGPYLTDVTQRAVGENGVVMPLGPFGSITAKSFFPTCDATGRRSELQQGRSARRQRPI